jgi:hypothetical protein
MSYFFLVANSGRPTSFSIQALNTSIGGTPCKNLPLSVVRLYLLIRDNHKGILTKVWIFGQNHPNFCHFLKFLQNLAWRSMNSKSRLKPGFHFSGPKNIFDQSIEVGQDT